MQSEDLQVITGRKFLNEEHRLIMPAEVGRGVDTFAATFSAGPAMKTVVVGLLNDVSVESVQRLARTTYARVVDTIGLNDKRKPEQQIDTLLRLRPELILVAGGTDEGATLSVRHLIEIIGLACYILPTESRPALLYAGNKNMAEEIKTGLQNLTSYLSISPNIRPDLETEDLQPAQNVLAKLYSQVRRNHMSGVDELNTLTENTLMPTSYAEGRIIRFLSQVYDSAKGILGVDVGASAASMAASFGGDLTLGVYPQLGLGEGLSNLLRFTSLSEIMKWLTLEIPADSVRDYIYQKSIYPGSVASHPRGPVFGTGLGQTGVKLGYDQPFKRFSSPGPACLTRPCPLF